MNNLPYIYNDAGRKQNRPSERNDCTVRALAISTNIDYSVAHDFLKERGRKCRKSFLFPKKRSDDCALGYEFVWKSFPLVKGKKRMSPERFAIEFSKGVYICKTVKHVYAVVSGVINDTYKVGWYGGRCVYGCWKVKEIEDE
tara:strand:- start:3256 stop:3681 length:426 start_codon:yes stop_codon:yes gene_type:complete